MIGQISARTSFAPASVMEFGFYCRMESVDRVWIFNVHRATQLSTASYRHWAMCWV